MALQFSCLGPASWWRGASGLGWYAIRSSGNGETAHRANRDGRGGLMTLNATTIARTLLGIHVHLGHLREQPRRADFRAA